MGNSRILLKSVFVSFFLYILITSLLYAQKSNAEANLPSKTVPANNDFLKNILDDIIDFQGELEDKLLKVHEKAKKEMCCAFWLSQGIRRSVNRKPPGFNIRWVSTESEITFHRPQPSEESVLEKLNEEGQRRLEEKRKTDHQIKELDVEERYIWYPPKEDFVRDSFLRDHDLNTCCKFAWLDIGDIYNKSCKTGDCHKEAKLPQFLICYRFYYSR